jgi:hypothetical protein
VLLVLLVQLVQLVQLVLLVQLVQLVLLVLLVLLVQNYLIPAPLTFHRYLVQSHLVWTYLELQAKIDLLQNLHQMLVTVMLQAMVLFLLALCC